MAVTTARETHLLLKGLAVGESPRWHAGRLWFSNWGAQQVMAVDLEGKSEVMVRVQTTVPFSIDWLPDGRLLIVSGREARLLRRDADGQLITHADLSVLSTEPWNEIVVDGRGNIYVNCTGFDFGNAEFRPGIIALVAPNGSVRQVADNIAFPNGMVVTPDNSTLIIAESFPGRLTAFDIAADGSLSNRRVWAELGRGGDGICLDADGAIWSSAVLDGKTVCIRVREGGQVLQRIETEKACFACMLGGDDGRTLFMMTAAFQSIEKLPELFRSRTGEVWTAPAPAPHAGRP
jgi:sugar lactone lactonase YvrE